MPTVEEFFAELEQRADSRDFNITPVYLFSNRSFSPSKVIAELAEVRTAFEANIERLKAQMLFWVIAINTAREMERAEAVAELEKTGSCVWSRNIQKQPSCEYCM